MTGELLLQVGGGLLVVGVAVAVLLAFADDGPGRRAWLRYVGRLERDRQALFLGTSGREIAGAQVVGLVLVMALGIVQDDRAFALVPLVAAAPRVALHLARHKRARELDEQLNGWLLMLANMLKVTGSLGDAIAHTADLTRGPLGQEIDLLLKEIRVGVPLGEALRNMAGRIGSTTFSAVVTIMLIGRTTGGELPTLLEETAATIRERMRLEGVIRKQTAMGRAQLVVLFLGPPVIIYMFKKVEPTFFDPLFESGFLGYLMVTVATVFWIASLAMARRILAVDI